MTNKMHQFLNVNIQLPRLMKISSLSYEKNSKQEFIFPLLIFSVMNLQHFCCFIHIFLTSCVIGWIIFSLRIGMPDYNVILKAEKLASVKNSIHTQSFSLGDWGVPPVGKKIGQSPPSSGTRPHFPPRACPPPPDICPRKFSKFQYIFV